MAEQELDRNETATPYKLEKAREKGSVAKSVEVVSAVVFTCATTYVIWRGWDVWKDHFNLSRALIVMSGQIELSESTFQAIFSHLFFDLMRLGAPFFFVIILAAILSNILQTGFVLSADPITPDWERMNPMNVFKKLFSFRTVFELFRTLVKLGLLAAVMYFSLKTLHNEFYQLATYSAPGITKKLINTLAEFGLNVAITMLIIAAVDWLYVRREFSKKMRMSKRELKDENKQREGDPRIKSRIRQLQRESFKRSLASRRTSEADVLLTNPTHYAVAIVYRHGQMRSPKVLAKGAGASAAEMRRIAALHSIPVVTSPVLTRKLFHSAQIDDFVAEQYFAEIAKILVWVFAMRGAKSTNGFSESSVQ